MTRVATPAPGVGSLVHVIRRECLHWVILLRCQGRIVTYAAIGRATGVTTPDVRDRNSWRIAISKIPEQIGSGPLRPVAETELNVGYRLVVPPAGAPPTS